MSEVDEMLRRKDCPQDESDHKGCATCEGAGAIYVIDYEMEQYEDELPDDMTDAEYDRWFKRSRVVDGVRMGPKFPAGPADAGSHEPIRALIADWRERARLARVLESAPLTAEKRKRTAEWMHYTNRANELEAALAASASAPAAPRETDAE